MQTMKLILIALLLIGIVHPSHAEPKKNKDAAAGKKKLDKWLQKPFNDQVTTMDWRKSKELPGNDVVAIYHALVKKNHLFTKSEFEKTEEFNQRLEGLESTPLVDNLKFGDTIAFSLYSKKVYDADSGILTAEVDTETLYGTAGTVFYSAFKEKNRKHVSLISIEISQKKVMEKKFTGENAFGRKVKAVAKWWANYSLALEDPGKLRFKIPVAPMEAREVSSFGGIIITGKLRYPYIDSDEDHSAATTNDPIEETIMKLYVGFEPKEVWFYNMLTGKVYKKIDITDLEK